MSKVVDLTGLSRAITKIKEWVNGILDWDADEGQDGHIKNRTHYKRVLLDFSVSSVVDDENFVWGKDPERDTIYVEMEYTINGYTHTLKKSLELYYDVVIDFEGGELRIGSDGESGKAFIEYYCHSESELSIERAVVYECVKLPEAFIPSTIARQESVTELKKRITALENIVAQITEKVEG